MATGLGNGASMRAQSRANLFSSFNSFEDSSHSRNGGFGSRTSYDNNIWGNSGFSHAQISTDRSVDESKDTESDPAPSFLQGRTGSSSLLASSEADNWNSKQRSAWGSANGYSTQKNAMPGSQLSPTKQRLNDRNAPSLLSNTRSNSPFQVRTDAFEKRSGSIPSTTFAIGSTNGFPSHRRSDTAFSAFVDPHLSNENDERAYPNFSGGPRAFSNNLFQSEGTAASSESDFISNIARHNSGHSASRTPSFMSNSQTRRSGPTPYTHSSSDSFPDNIRGSTSYSPSRSTYSTTTNSSAYSSHDSQDLSQGLGRMTLRGNAPSHQPASRASRRSRIEGHSSFDAPLRQSFYHSNPENRCADFGEISVYSGTGFAGEDARNGDGLRRDRSQELHISSTEIPYASSSRASERSLSGLQSATPDMSAPTMALQSARLPYHNQYDVLSQQAFINPNMKYYHHLNPALYGFPSAPLASRFPGSDNDPNQLNRSPLLRDFRTSFKSRQWELKDIYNHVVEFCGDQHGSRMIQERLETASGEDKEQVFSEILPAALAIMVDIFGNYVIQKLFEHGNQVQKKALAEKLETRVRHLTTHVYGCRVVQKALERVLPDQQAVLIHELDKSVIDCVKDQNGNHVIQKAIEWVPNEELQPIINAVLEHVKTLAIDKFGCRVVQRMLEHCQQPVRQRITQDLRSNIPFMTSHQYGNYVIQNILANGPEEDRRMVTDEVTSKLLHYCKNKFASNVVEKALEHAPAEQKAEIVKRLTTPNEKGDSPIVALADDNFGNYVLQKVWKDLSLSEQDRLANLMKPHIAHMRRMGCGAKPIAAIEKLIYEGERGQERKIDRDREPSQSSTSTSETSSLLPSTNASTVEGPIGSEASEVTIGAPQVLSPAKTE
ncbi:MAG: hypothetical protein Q9227_007730 [Pyrenula ochraceoflavens]